MPKIALIFALQGTPILARNWWGANKLLGLVTFWAEPIPTWNSWPSLTKFLSVHRESNEIVELFLIDSLSRAYVSTLGINIGTYKYKLIIVILIASTIVVYKLSCRSAVLNVIWKPKFLVIFLNI